jgi:hypothetical protein
MEKIDDTMKDIETTRARLFLMTMFNRKVRTFFFVSVYFTVGLVLTTILYNLIFQREQLNEN